jgi:hypothetical protein
MPDTLDPAAPKKAGAEAKGIVLLVGGGAAYIASYAIEGKEALVVRYGGLAAAAVGLYYLVVEGWLGKPATTGQAGGLVGKLEDILLGGLEGPEESKVPTVNQPPPPDADTLPNLIPIVGSILSPEAESTAKTYPGYDFYRLTVRVTNQTGQAVTGALEVHADEDGPLGGTDSIVQLLEGVTLGPGETKDLSLDVRTDTPPLSISRVNASVFFAGHHVSSRGYWVE